MNKRFLVFGVLLIFSSSAYSLTVALTSNQTEVSVNDSITFHLEVRDAGQAGGQLVFSRKVDEKTFVNVGRPIFASSCTLCKGVRDLGDINEDVSRIFLEAGEYRATATYGGVTRTVDFTVLPITTTSSSTISSYMKPSTTSAPTSSTSTSYATTSSTAEVPSTAPEDTVDGGINNVQVVIVEVDNREEHSYLPYMLFLAFLALSFLYLRKR